MGTQRSGGAAAVAVVAGGVCAPDRGRLRRVDWTRPAITRRRCGRGFRYIDAHGRPVADPDVLDRIRRLAIPPAWTDVWICDHPMGHLQAVGTDAAGRRQYRYHDLWRARRDQRKFDHMVAFARALPTLRRRVARDLAEEGLTRERVLAAAVRLLDLGFFRIGTESYKRTNGTHGLVTLHREHVRVTTDGRLCFDFVAKGSKRRVQTVVDPDVAAVVRRLKRRRGGGEELLAWRDGDRWVDVRSADVNAYIKEAAGGDFSAKDFRTWSATVLAFVSLAEAGEPPVATTARRRIVNQAVKRVALHLGNTPAVARSSYIDPRVLDRWASGEAAETLGSLRASLRTADLDGDLPQDLLSRAVEQAVLRLLDDEPEPVRRSA